MRAILMSGKSRTLQSMGKFGDRRCTGNSHEQHRFPGERFWRAPNFVKWGGRRSIHIPGWFPIPDLPRR
jgi:hypothetical protein